MADRRDLNQILDACIGIDLVKPRLLANVVDLGLAKLAQEYQAV